MSDLQQFVGATIERVTVSPVGTPGDDGHSIGLSLRLTDGSWRGLELYTLGDHALHVRIDGMYVPPEEL